MQWTPDKKEEAFSDIIKLISEGRSVRSIIDGADRKLIPSMPTFYEWLEENEEYSKRYARACESRAELIFEEILEIADDSEKDTLIDEDGNERINTEFVQRSRLKIDARKWMLGKMQPTKYGDKTIIEGGDKPIVINFED